MAANAAGRKPVMKTGVEVDYFVASYIGRPILSDLGNLDMYSSIIVSIYSHDSFVDCHPCLFCAIQILVLD